MTTYYHSSSVFMTNNMPSGVIKHQKSTKPESLLFLQTGLLKSVWLFHNGFCTKQQHFTLSSAQTLKSYGAVQTSHWRTVLWLLCDAISSFVCMHTNHLVMKGISLKIAALEIQSVYVELQGEALSSLVGSTFEQMPSQWFFRQYCIYNYSVSLWEQIWCSVVDGKLQLKHAPAARKLA